MARYELWLCDNYGTQLALLDMVVDFSCWRVVNGVGGISLRLPETFDRTMLKADRVIEFWRGGEVNGRKLPLRMENAGTIRRRRTRTDSNGGTIVAVTCADINELTERRIVAYASGAAQALKTGNADNLMKEIINENLGSGAAVAARNIGVTDDPDLSAGPSLTRGFSNKNVLTVLQDLGKSAKALGTAVYWTMDYMPIYGGAPLINFRTGTTQLNQDHSSGGVAPVYFGLEWGNLEEPDLDENYEDEITYAYAGGRGDMGNRDYQTASDSDRINRSIWNRREAFIDARNEATAGVTAAANQLLAAGRPKLRFTGRILDTPQARYGVDWDFGDRVVVTYLGYQWDALVKAVQISVNAEGAEQITAQVEVEDVLM